MGGWRMIPESPKSFKTPPKSQFVTPYLLRQYSRRNLADAVVAEGENRYTVAFANNEERPPPQVLAVEGIMAAFFRKNAF